MVSHISVDIETYSSEDIKRVGLYRYTEAPDFDILLIAYSVNGGPVALVDLVEDPPELLQAELTTFLNWLRSPDVIVHAYNAVFEWRCLTVWAERNGWLLDPQGLLRRMRCTMLAGTYCGYPAGLEAVGEALGLPQDKQKLSVGRALIRLFCRPCKPSRANGMRTRTEPEHEPEKWELFKEYCKQDVVTEMAVADKLKAFPVPEAELRRWRTDARINARGVRVDLPLVESALAVDAEVTGALEAEAVGLSGLDNPKSVQQLTLWLEQQGVTTEDLRKDTVKELLGGDGVDDTSRRMLEIRQELSRTSVKKYLAMRDAVCADGRVRGLLQFYGARTGRWAGRLVQVQNLPQNHLETLGLARELTGARKLDALRLIYGNVPDVLSQLIRTAFIPSEGRRFLVADYSAIEARVIAWLAGESWRQEVFRRGGDIYCASASQMFKVPVEKHGVNGHLRQKGKIAELALGYQGAAGALRAMGALKMGLAEEELPDIVARWRESNPRIVGLWYACETKAIDAVKTGVKQVLQLKEYDPERARMDEDKTGAYPESYSDYFNIGAAVTFRRRIAGDQDQLVIELPSGRCLYYPAPMVTLNARGRESLSFRGLDQGSKKWGPQETYGGKLVENITQAIARDCLAEAIDRLEAAGYEIVMHVHDEVIIDAEPDQQLQDAIRLMTEPLPWAPGLQLAADGFETGYYRKD